MTDEEITAAANEAIDWDDRKTLADIWQAAHGPVSDLGELYEPLIAVAQYGARRALENL